MAKERKRRKEGFMAMTLRITLDEEDKIKKLAALQQRSVSEIVTILLQSYIGKHYKPEYESHFIKPIDL
jgi:hypothetical protein